MLRNSIAVVGGTFLSFALNIAGARLAWLLIIGNVDRSENKDAFAEKESEVMIEAQNYSDWRLKADEILRFRGPKW